MPSNWYDYLWAMPLAYLVLGLVTMLLFKPRGWCVYCPMGTAVLLDVRTPQEYREGHIPGSKNVPLQSLDKIVGLADNQDTPLFVYCHSGARSRQAVSALRRMGYTNVKNIGGIAAWTGKVER